MARSQQRRSGEGGSFIDFTSTAHLVEWDGVRRTRNLAGALGPHRFGDLELLQSAEVAFEPFVARMRGE